MNVADAAPIVAALFFLVAIVKSRIAPAAGRVGYPSKRRSAKPAAHAFPRASRSDRPSPAEADFIRPRAKQAMAGEGRLEPGGLAPVEFRGFAATTQRKSRGFGKRGLDIAAATALLLVSAPLMLVAAIAIKLDSPGPILYLQRRIGCGGREFDMFKFRSMVVDAETNGAQWAAENDRRVTRIGRFLRKTRFDEIPQAFNILRGEMSFVGPRPERPEFVRVLEKEIPNYHLRHAVRPGLTGWAQVKYVYGASVDDARIKLQYDLHYIRHFTLWLDCLIMLMTVRVALFGIGSR